MTTARPPRPSAANRPSAIDLFSGAGGLTEGLTNAGFDVRAAVEIDQTAIQTYKLNHQGVPVVDKDIRKVTGPELLAAARVSAGGLDLLSGCPPCQGFSTLRTRRRDSSDDPRNDLIFEVLRLVRSTRPRAVLIENVPGLANQERFTHFCRGLSAAGYGQEYAILDASSFGVPQRRSRLVLVGIRGGLPPKDWATPIDSRTTVREAISFLPPAGKSGDPLHDIPERRSHSVMERIRLVPQDGGNRADLPPSYQLDCHRRSTGFHDVYGRMAWDEISPTITSGCTNPSKGRFLHPSEHRAITLREAALLQSFPPDYRFTLARGKEHAALQIGNAFPPALIRPIASRILREVQR